ncbi:hypothetical protein SAMN05421636_109188 [Pricia antarctica]|uniref:Uncharacterized protein n=1 Tax=Pricia antarctica TaxID=641691 RepID=A0A1G7HIA8_9FLAO|nr:hypothetical protein SAMN05421636_109188 [Pricia antarctica]
MGKILRETEKAFYQTGWINFIHNSSPVLIGFGRLYQKQVVLHQGEIETDLDSISRFLSVSEYTHIVDLPLNRRTVNVLPRMKGLLG